MKIAACFLYCLFTILYAWYPFYSNAYLQLFNMGTLLLFICVLCAFQTSQIETTYKESIFFQYCIYLSLFRFIYTAYCIFMGKGWILYHTDLFNIFTSISFVIIILHCSFKKV